MAKGERFGTRLVRAMEQAVAHARGEIELEEVVYDVPEFIDVAEIRRRQKLTQKKFAEKYGFKLDAVRNWEQGRRKPDRAARILLKIIEQNPAAVEAALRAA
jgi:putative transcriptional regulator